MVWASESQIQLLLFLFAWNLISLLFFSPFLLLDFVTNNVKHRYFFHFSLNHNIFFRLPMPRNMLIVSYVETIWHPKSTISESTCTPWNIGNVPSLLDWMLSKTALQCLPAEQRVDSKLSKFPDPTILQVIFLENLSKTIYFNLSKLDL